MDFGKKDLPEPVNALAKQIVDAAYHVHRAIGPGLYESVYEACLGNELSKRNIAFERQKAIPLHYDGETLETAFRADFIVDNAVLIELKAVEKILPLHLTQVKTYLKLTGLQLGLLINFNTELIGQGIKRVVCTKNPVEERNPENE